MNSIENTYICLAAPLLLAILCLRGHWRRALSFLLAGMTSCLLSAYVSSFAASDLGSSNISSTGPSSTSTPLSMIATFLQICVTTDI